MGHRRAILLVGSLSEEILDWNTVTNSGFMNSEQDALNKLQAKLEKAPVVELWRRCALLGFLSKLWKATTVRLFRVLLGRKFLGFLFDLRMLVQYR